MSTDAATIRELESAAHRLETWFASKDGREALTRALGESWDPAPIARALGIAAGALGAARSAAEALEIIEAARSRTPTTH